MSKANSGMVNDDDFDTLGSSTSRLNQVNVELAGDSQPGMKRARESEANGLNGNGVLPSASATSDGNVQPLKVAKADPHFLGASISGAFGVVSAMPAQQPVNEGEVMGVGVVGQQQPGAGAVGVNTAPPAPPVQPQASDQGSTANTGAEDDDGFDDWEDG